MTHSMGRRRIVIGMVIILAMLGAALSGWQVAGAQSGDGFIYDTAPYDQLAGIREAVYRSYEADMDIYMYAQIVLFDTPENAVTGLEILNSYYLAELGEIDELALAPVEAPRAVSGTLAYAGPLNQPESLVQYSEVALVQAQDDVYAYTVYAIKFEPSADEVDVALHAATATLDAMAATPAGLATPAASPGEAPVSGTWSKFPAEDDEVPQRYGITYTVDRVTYAPEPLPDAVVGTYGNVEGLVSVVTREYEPPDNDAEAPIGWAVVQLAEFDGDQTAETGFAGGRDLVPLQLESAGVTIEVTAMAVDADEVVTYSGRVENEAGELIVALVVARSGAYVTIVVVSGPDDGEVLGMAEDLAQTVIDADAGDGEVAYDWDGASTGGIWDKVPLAGDEVLRGLVPWNDEEIYP